MNYLCVDFGGTKTLVCTLDEEGNIREENRFETPDIYSEFLDILASSIDSLTDKFQTGALSVPGLIDTENDTIIALGNKPWTNFSLRQDLQNTTGIDFRLLNDTKLAGLAEARYLQDKFSRVLYITVSTGIGLALCVDGELVPELIDMEFGKSPFFYEDRMTAWEEFAGGRGVVATYNKKASEIDTTDEKSWREISHKLVIGLGPACAAFQPDAIVFGGGVGEQSDKFSRYIQEELAEILHPVIRQPKALIQCHYKDKSVIYGCYELAKSAHEKQ